MKVNNFSPKLHLQIAHSTIKYHPYRRDVMVRLNLRLLSNNYSLFLHNHVENSYYWWLM